MLEYSKPVETEIGILVGRDAIFLDAMEYDGCNLTLFGSFNGHLASRPTDDDIFYTLMFKEVLALLMTELDSYLLLDGTCSATSNFDEIVNSKWVSSLGGKVTSDYKHYFFATYDDIFDIVCKDFHLQYDRRSCSSLSSLN